MQAISFTWPLTRDSTICHLNFSSNPNDLENTFRHMVVSEDDVVPQQIEEVDLRVYGEPSDIVEVDESAKLAKLPPKRSTSELKAAVVRLAKMRTTSKMKESNKQSSNVMGRNRDALALDAWLNQSASPSATAAKHSQESLDPQSYLFAQEVEEVKVFRNVYMAIAPSLQRVGAGIHCRNIMRRHPVIPHFLAHRFARLNYNCLERLRNENWEQSFFPFEIFETNHTATTLSHPFGSHASIPSSLPSLRSIETGGILNPWPYAENRCSSNDYVSFSGYPGSNLLEHNAVLEKETLTPMKWHCYNCGRVVQVKRQQQWE